MLAVARWEYLEKIKSKAFVLSLIIIPALMIGMGVLPGMLASRADSEPKIIGLFDQSGEMLDPLSARLDAQYRLPDNRPNYILRPVADSINTLNEGKNLVDALVVAGEIEGWVIIPRGIMQDSSVEYRSENVGNFRLTERLNSTIRDIIVERKLREKGIDAITVRELTSPLDMRTIKVSKSGAEESGFLQVFFGAYLFMMMMMFLVITSGQLLVRSMLEEKSNRVVEVLISSCSAGDLMAGKIIGLSGLGLTQMGVWVVIGIGVSLKFGLALVSPLSALLLLVYFVLGYLLYAGIFVALGSPISTEQEAQQLTSYVSMVLVVPIALALPVMQDPNSTLARVLTYFPLMTPTMMALRIPVHMPDAWEIISSLLLLAASAAGTMWAAGKIFRAAVLAYGKRPSIRELIRFIRAE